MSVAAHAVGDASPGVGWAGRGRVDTGADVARVLAAVKAGSRRRDRTSSIRRVVEQADVLDLASPDATRTLPVVSELAGLLSLTWAGGLKRGATAVVAGSTSLLFALLAEAVA